MKKITFAIVLIVALVIGSVAGFAATSTTNSDAAANTSFTGTETHSHPTTTETLAPATDDVVNECEHEEVLIYNYTSETHTYSCFNCDDVITEAHSFENVFEDDGHYIKCMCGYVSEFHQFVFYHEVDEHTHVARCHHCEQEEVQEHSSEFDCSWCEYKASGSFVGIVLETYEKYISLLVEDCRYDFFYEFYANASYSKGDFVLINYTGYDITSLVVIIDYDVFYNKVIYDLDNWQDYTPEFVRGGHTGNCCYYVQTKNMEVQIDGKYEYLSNCVIYDFESSSYRSSPDFANFNFILWIEHEGKTIVLSIY